MRPGSRRSRDRGSHGIALLASTLALLGAGCLMENRLGDGGTASETTNQIAGVLVTDKGEAAARIQVRLVASGFDPSRDIFADSLCDTTDAMGRYRFRNPRPGSYRVEAGLPADREVGGRESFHYTGGRLNAGSIRLCLPGYLSVTLPDSLRARGGAIFIPGSTYLAEVGEHRHILLGPLPRLRNAFLDYARNPVSERIVLARDISVDPGVTVELRTGAQDTAILPKDTARIRSFALNTTATGAHVDGDAYGFPLLLRLDSADFGSGGETADRNRIRFSKPDGTPLPFEIERWDGASRKAEIWIAMDTVQGNCDTQTFVMRQEPAGATAPASALPVFTAAAGFAAVWHLAEAIGDQPDASGNGHWAVPAAFDGSESTEGALGPGLRLSGQGYLDAGPVDIGSPLTVSAWVRTDPVNYRAAIVQKPASGYPPQSHFAYILEQYGVNDATYRGLSFGISDGNEFPIAVSSQGDAPWTWVCGTYDGETMSLYRDGALVATRPQHFAAGVERNGLNVLIGAYVGDAAYGKFSGLVDEIRIESRARSADWIRLNYANQKPGQVFIGLK